MNSLSSLYIILAILSSNSRKVSWNPVSIYFLFAFINSLRFFISYFLFFYTKIKDFTKLYVFNSRSFSYPFTCLKVADILWISKLIPLILGLRFIHLMLFRVEPYTSSTSWKQAFRASAEWCYYLSVMISAIVIFMHVKELIFKIIITQCYFIYNLSFLSIAP